jgi:TRAP-type mannitol/chloroaromatic compound transport system substrate-binding protein
MAVCVGGSAAAADLKLLSSWSKLEWPTWVVIETYVKSVHERGNAVKIDIKGPETVPPFQQIQPVSSGAFDMLFTHGVYHAGSKGLTLVADAIELDPYKRREHGIVDFFDKYYQKHNNLKMVALVPISMSGYHMFLRAPPSPEGDIKGRKIRGTASYHGVIKALGGAPVVLPTADIYSALEKGVVDGSCMPAGGMLNMKHYEVAKFAVRPTFGSSNSPILVNLERWNKLAKAEQDVLLEAGKLHEFRMPWIGQEILAKEEAELKKLGVSYVSLPADKAALVKKTWNESLWELAKQCCADGADDLRALAKKHGMTD